jgi:predicted Zn-dependent peptidase
MLTILAVVALVYATPLAQVATQGQAGQVPSMKGVVLKGKAPVSNEILKIKLPRPQEADLPNGIHLMVLEDHRAPLVQLQLQIRGAGGYYDPADLPGIAGMTASMMTEGTTTRNTRQIAQEQETMASMVSLGTSMSSQTAAMSVYSLADNFDRTLDLAADILLNPVFPEEEFARYKTRQKASLVQLRSNPSFLAQERFSRVMYGDHPGSRIMMSPEALDRATRDALVNFHKAHYVPDSAIIAVVGDITFAEARKKVEAKFGGWKKAGVAVPPVQDPPPVGPAKIYLVDRPNSVQTSLIVGTSGINRTNPEYDAMSLMNTVIGGGPTGRLFLNLREEKGWTYGAYSTLSTLRYRGHWMASTEIRGDVTEGAVREILNEIDRLRTERIADKEVGDKKRSMVASFALSLESPMSIMSNYITSRIYNFPADYWDRYPERMAAITQDQVQADAKKYLEAGHIQIVAVGDAKKIGDVLKKFGTVEVYDTEGKVKGTT